MKLPQYRLLKISSSRKGTSIEAEWVDFVTCGECKYWNNETDLTYCERTVWFGTNADDYCSFGERKGADDEHDK